MAGGKSSWAFGPVNDGNVEEVFRNLALSWYMVALIQFVGQAYFIFVLGYPAGDMVDPFVALFAGFFLNKRRSRAVAVMLLVYALLTLALTIANKLGFTQGGTNILLALVVGYLAVRAISATWFYQRRRCARIRWTPVIAVSFAAAAAAFAAVSIVAIALRNALAGGTLFSQQFVDFCNSAAMFFPPAITVALLTLWWPFSDADPVCPWPPKKQG